MRSPVAAAAAHGPMVTLAGVLLATAVAAFSCQGYVAHEFGGYAYNATLDCLQAPGVVDVIAGADPGQCPMLRCWESPCGVTYVTDEACDAPVGYVDMTRATSGPCVEALAIYARAGHGQCPTPADGGGGAGGSSYVGCGL